MTVRKAVELLGTGDTIQDAVIEALDRAQMTLEGITGFSVREIAGVVTEGRTTYEVQLTVWFTLLERIHG